MNPKKFLLSLVTRPGYEINKYRVQRWLRRGGLHVQIAGNTKFSYEACNFGIVPQGKPPVIFDVGANIGQSSIWFLKSFPPATIYAFEPFRVVYEQLKKQLGGEPRVHCRQCAIGAADGTIDVPSQRDPFSQIGRVEAANGSHAETESIVVCKVDSFCSEQKIEYIHILKTDTEGYDLDVLRGAEAMLRSGRIGNIMTEASIQADDGQHTSLFALMEHLRPFAYELHGIYDLHHGREDGRLDYFNALFRLKPNR